MFKCTRLARLTYACDSVQAQLSIPRTPCPKTPHPHSPSTTHPHPPTHPRRTLTRGTRREDWRRGHATALFFRRHSTHEPPPRTLGPALAATHATQCLSPHPHLDALPSRRPYTSISFSLLQSLFLAFHAYHMHSPPTYPTKKNETQKNARGNRQTSPLDYVDSSHVREAYFCVSFVLPTLRRLQSCQINRLLKCCG